MIFTPTSTTKNIAIFKYKERPAKGGLPILPSKAVEFPAKTPRKSSGPSDSATV